MYIVILAGGSGTRFWPLSRQKHPKQLMSVFGDKSMLQRTVERVLPLGPKRVLVITNALQAEETARQLAHLTTIPIDIIPEPVGRNTAPAIALAAEIIAWHDPDGVMAVLPADHYIADEEAFRVALQKAQETALSGALVTLGILPTRPETGYGYIEADKAAGADGVLPVVRFVEKPLLEKALGFLAAGNFYWNSGMFIWRVTAILDEIRVQMPELAQGLARLVFSEAVWQLADLQTQIDAIYWDLPGQSIDYGVMEHARQVLVIPAEFGWSDVGTWSALPDVLPADGEGHVAINTPHLVSIDARSCLVHGDGRMVALVGVEGLVVVNTRDALLVCPNERAQEVKLVVAELERRGLAEYL